MSLEAELKSLSDDELLDRLLDRLADKRRNDAELVAHIGEVDARRLYAREGWPSMFQYCTGALHLSEAETYRRIGAARLARRYPVISTMLEDGRIHLCGVSVLGTHLTDANHEELLARAAHKTKKQIEKLVAELAPKPDVKASIRKKPERKVDAAPATTSSLELQPSKVTPPTRPPRQDKPPTVKPLAPARYHVQFTVSTELRDKIERLQALMPGNDLASIIDAAVSEKLERIEARRFGKTQRPRKTVEEADISPGVRDISAPVRRFVWERDGGQCTYVSPDGRRCPERHRLEFHHDDPYALGGDRSPSNIFLLCKAHNQYMARLDYGKEKMDVYRRSADRVGEPEPSFQLCPGTVPALRWTMGAHPAL